MITTLVPTEFARAVEIPSRFEFRGSGYGHGVGMSQFGAYGQALEGKPDQKSQLTITREQ